MFKKLLSLSIALVMISGIMLVAPDVSPALENAHASEAVSEVTASSFEAIKVNKATDTGVVKLTGGYKAGSSDSRLTYNGRTSSSATTDSTQWFYFKYDISDFQNLAEIESAVLSFSFNFNKNIKGVYIKELKKETWDNAVSDIEKVAEDSTTVIDATKYPYPYDDTTVETLGTVNRSYGNAEGNELEYKLTGIEYKRSTNTNNQGYRTSTITGGPLLEKIKACVEDGYFYFSVCIYSTNTTATNRYGTLSFYSALNDISASTKPMVIYNSVNGSRFNTTVTTLDRETDFNYTANIAAKDTNVRLLVAIYGKYGALEDIIVSDKLSSNDGNLSLTVPLSGYPDATSVRCYIWDAATSEPYAEPKVTPVKTELQELYSGKKVIFIGDSNVYWGRAVEANSSNKLSNRQNDEGIFYQICKTNGIDISVTNWTYGSHGWWALFDTEECTVNSSCDGVNHEEQLTDRNYDYVFLGLTRSETDESKLDEYMTKITGLFREANPNVQIIVLAPTMIYGISDTGVVREGTIDSLKTMEEKYSVKVCDWGRIVYDILEGNVTVPGTKQEWVKSTFVTKDKKHVNLLGGYMTALMAYCVFTGEKAEGQNYDFFKDSSAINVQGYVNSYYNNGDSDTNFPEILASETEMKGIQQLIDKYIAEKPYLNGFNQ